MVLAGRCHWGPVLLASCPESLKEELDPLGLKADGLFPRRTCSVPGGRVYAWKAATVPSCCRAGSGPTSSNSGPSRGSGPPRGGAGNAGHIPATSSLDRPPPPPLLLPPPPPAAEFPLRLAQATVGTMSSTALTLRIMCHPPDPSSSRAGVGTLGAAWL